MNKIELKANLHGLIDQIDSMSLLKEYYTELKNILSSNKTSLWDTLSEEQKKAVLLSFEESEDDNNLLDNDEVMNKYKEWL